MQTGVQCITASSCDVTQTQLSLYKKQIYGLLSETSERTRKASL
jgi:hypothetical protein